jgi:hypothetical protein
MDIRTSPSFKCEAGHRLNEYRRRPDDRAHRLLCPRCDADEIAMFAAECGARDARDVEAAR